MIVFEYLWQCEDTPERYAYLMGKMREGLVTESQMRLLSPVPTEQIDDEDEQNEESPEQVSRSPPVSKQSRPAPAFLQAIQNGNKKD